MNPELVYLAPAYTFTGRRWHLAILAKIAAKQALAALYRVQYVSKLVQLDWKRIDEREHEYKAAQGFLSLMAEEEYRERQRDLIMTEIAMDSVNAMLDTQDEWEKACRRLGIEPETDRRGE